MQIATILSSHADTDLTVNTIQSIQRWVGNDLFVLIDGATWNSWGKKATLGVPKLQGLYHNSSISPHKNLTVGLKTALNMWPNADWFCLTEYDVLFGNDSFKEDLVEADKNGVWMLGNDYREENQNMSFLEQMFKMKFDVGSKYFLGCCVFLNAKFVKKLEEIDFFHKFLWWTNAFERGYIPHFTGYSFVEHLFPTMAYYCGGKLQQLAKWNQYQIYQGNFRRYPMRFTPEIDSSLDCFAEAAIMHPVKDINSPLRLMYRRHHGQHASRNVSSC